MFIVDIQDLKDLMRKAGDVTYANAHKDRRNEGWVSVSVEMGKVQFWEFDLIRIVEFASRRDMERAMDKFDDYELNGRRIKVGKLLVIINKNLHLRSAAYREQVEPRQIPKPLQIQEQEKILRGKIPQQRPPWTGLPLTLQGPQQISLSFQVSKEWIEVLQKSQPV